MTNATLPRGLSPDEVERSRAQNGANVFTKVAKRGFLRRFFGNLNDPVIKVLLGALVLHLVLLFRENDWVETAGIAASIWPA